MALDVAEASEALDLARAGNRVVQAGTQYRSHGGYHAAARELAAGAVGTVSRVTAQANFNGARWARPFADCKAADVDWAAYLFNRPARPFDPKLLRRWQLYRDFTNGLPGLWMSHYADAVHLLTGAKYPSAAVALGGVYAWKDGREHADTVHAALDYPEGFLFDWGMGLGNAAGTHFRVHGTKGTLDLGTNYASPTEVTITPEGGPKASGSARKVSHDPSPDHMANWLECLRTRQRPRADIEYGHQHAIATILTAAALETGRRQRYDPARREVRPG
jgi:predicted dehydrogenase